MGLIWLALLLVAVTGVGLILRVYRMAMDPRTRVRDPEGREMDARELGDDRPPELRD